MSATESMSRGINRVRGLQDRVAPHPVAAALNSVSGDEINLSSQYSFEFLFGAYVVEKAPGSRLCYVKQIEVTVFRIKILSQCRPEKLQLLYLPLAAKLRELLI